MTECISEIAGAAPDLPFFYYSIDFLTGINGNTLMHYIILNTLVEYAVIFLKVEPKKLIIITWVINACTFILSTME